MKVVLDANVLYPAVLRSLLIDLALFGAYEAHWSQVIQDEWQRNLLLNRPELKAEQLRRVELLMNQALPNALIQGYEAALHGIELPDPDDAHVVAAAYHVGATVIMTANLKDFPQAVLEQYSIVTMSPDDFLSLMLEQQAAQVKQALQLQVERYRNPPVTLKQLLQRLEKQGLSMFSKRIQEQL